MKNFNSIIKLLQYFVIHISRKGAKPQRYFMQNKLTKDITKTLLPQWLNNILTTLRVFATLREKKSYSLKVALREPQDDNFHIGFKTLILTLLLFSFSLFADSSTTTLTDLKQIEIFNDVTSRIRCICLPSLPIKSCSFNNCAISAQLKLFMENRIRKGESANEIVQKMQTGFGEEILSDPIVQKLQASGSENMVAGLVSGFGEKILAQPDSTWINMTLFAGMALGLGLIFYYLKGRLKKEKVTSEVGTKNAIPQDAEKYLKEIDG